MKKLKKNEKGFTLLAVILTVVIMLILVGVVVTFALGENGVLKSSLRGRIMGRVQSLDDTVKAYTMKNDDIYSSSKKGLQDLVKEGMIQKIPMGSGKSLYYVTNAGLEKLNLKFTTNEFNISDQESYTLEELQQKGIYVIDHSLNAAYLEDGETYGKIVNYGTDLNIADGKEINGKIVHIKPKKKVESNQEIVLMIDRTVSMGMYVTAQPSGAPNDTIPIVMEGNTIKVEEGYNLTRWAETVKAMDSFIDSYLPADNKLKKLTIFTYYGQNASDLSVEYLGTFTNGTAAKNSYANIFTIEQYETLLYNLINNNMSLSSNTNYFQKKRVNNKYTYYIDCRILNPKFAYLFRNGTNSTNSAPTLGYGTCTPIALQRAYEYIQENKEDGIPKDFLIMTDGDANISLNFTSTTNNSSIINTIKREMTFYSNLIINTFIKDRTVGVYAVGFSPDANGFDGYFGGNITRYFSATEIGALSESFAAVFEEVNLKNRTVITDGKISDEYSNVLEIKIEVYNSRNTSMKKVFSYTPDGPYMLSNIYANQMLNLKEAFDLIDNDRSITSEYDTIDVNILYTVTLDEDSDDV